MDEKKVLTSSGKEMGACALTSFRHQPYRCYEHLTYHEFMHLAPEV